MAIIEYTLVNQLGSTVNVPTVYELCDTQAELPVKPDGSLAYALDTDKFFVRKAGAWFDLTGGGGGPGGMTATNIIVTFDYPAKVSQRVTITDAAVTTASLILVWLQGLPDDDPDSSMEDSLMLQAIPGTGEFILSAESRMPFAGNFSINYTVI